MKKDVTNLEEILESIFEKNSSAGNSGIKKINVNDFKANPPFGDKRFFPIIVALQKNPKDKKALDSLNSLFNGTNFSEGKKETKKTDEKKGKKKEEEVEEEDEEEDEDDDDDDEGDEDSKEDGKGSKKDKEDEEDEDDDDDEDDEDSGSDNGKGKTFSLILKRYEKKIDNREFSRRFLKNLKSVRSMLFSDLKKDMNEISRQFSKEFSEKVYGCITSGGVNFSSMLRDIVTSLDTDNYYPYKTKINTTVVENALQSLFSSTIEDDVKEKNIQNCKKFFSNKTVNDLMTIHYQLFSNKKIPFKMEELVTSFEKGSSAVIDVLNQQTGSSKKAKYLKLGDVVKTSTGESDEKIIEVTNNDKHRRKIQAKVFKDIMSYFSDMGEYADLKYTKNTEYDVISDSEYEEESIHNDNILGKNVEIRGCEGLSDGQYKIARKRYIDDNVERGTEVLLESIRRGKKDVYRIELDVDEDMNVMVKAPRS